MTGRPFVGLLAALFVEASHWLKLRWEFDDSAYESAWQLSFVLVALTGVAIWLDESRITAVLVLITWLPLLLLPLQFVQSYGMRDSMDLSAFSMFARRSRLRNRRLGLKVDPVRLNFGNVLFVVTLLSAAMGMDQASWLFLPGVVLLCGWALLASGRCRWTSLMPVMVVACLLGFAGQIGLEHLEKWLRRGSGDHGEHFNPNFHSTLIGSRGRVLLSPEVIWRMKVEPGDEVPRLLRTMTFQNFLGTSWQNQRRKFEEINARVVDADTYHLLTEILEVEDFRRLPSYRLRGSVRDRYPLPLPGDAAGIRGLRAELIEQNLVGTVQVTPDEPVIECEMFWKGGTNPESAPAAGETLRMAPREREAVQRVVQQLKLDQLTSMQAKLARLQRWFAANFRYTLDLTIRQPSHRERMGLEKKPSAMEQFLTETRAGHCEYFASAATLILNEAGLHSRYAIGFGVVEGDPKSGEYVIRGTHRHAWCRVWDEQSGMWIDFDPTPPNWFASFQTNDDRMQQLKDWLKRVREDFYLWRTDPDNELMVILVISGMGLCLSGFVVRRLWKSRSQVKDGDTAVIYQGVVVRTPLHSLERLAAKLLGPRPAGMPYAQWLTGLNSQQVDAGFLSEVITLHQRLRFDPEPAPPEVHQRLEELAGKLELQLRDLSAG